MYSQYWMLIVEYFNVSFQISGQKSSNKQKNQFYYEYSYFECP